MASLEDERAWLSALVLEQHVVMKPLRLIGAASAQHAGVRLWLPDFEPVHGGTIQTPQGHQDTSGHPISRV